MLGLVCKLLQNLSIPFLSISFKSPYLLSKKSMFVQDLPQHPMFDFDELEQQEDVAETLPEVTSEAGMAGECLGWEMPAFSTNLRRKMKKNFAGDHMGSPTKDQDHCKCCLMFDSFLSLNFPCWRYVHCFFSMSGPKDFPAPGSCEASRGALELEQMGILMKILGIFSWKNIIYIYHMNIICGCV